MVPHGSQFSCEVCHTPTGGLNDFGFDSFDYLSDNRGSLDWAGLAMVDSDRDGYPNGVELGDPNGTWRPGDPTPSGMFSHPGDRNDGLCGNNTFEGEEDCEGNNLNGESCSSLGLGTGTLRCADTCTFDTALCNSCGDGVRQESEACEGSDFGGQTCESMGLGPGTLSCNGCQIDTSGCGGGDSFNTGTCGDGSRSGNELCDGSDHAGQTCVTLGYDGGVLGCLTHCTYDTSGCIGDVPDVPVSQAGQGASAATSPAVAGAGVADDGRPEPIVLDGRACSTTNGSAPAGVWWLALLAGFVAARRRR